jgi:S-adenosyl-L-methionine hydrolase (adenosine-forming)
MRRPMLTLITDFGYADGYLGAVKGVVLGICPDAVLVDIAHDIPPQAVRQAAYALATAAPYFPPGTVHLIVVDPGVGSQRRPIAVQTERALYVAPDNGVLSLTLGQDSPRLAVHLNRSAYHLSPVSATFHGRDIFAPVAAHLAAGIALSRVGEPLAPSDLTFLPASQPVRSPDGSWLAEIVHIDHFGNLITNLPWAESKKHPTGLSIRVGGALVPIARTYADVEPGEMVAYVGSSGRIEIGVREGDAARKLGVNVGAPVEVSALASTPHPLSSGGTQWNGS